MPKKTDQFRIRGSEPVKDAVGSLRGLTGAMDQLVDYPRDRSTAHHGSADPFDEAQERFKDNMKNASTITIDDCLIWNAMQHVVMQGDDPTSWDQETRDRFRVAKERFEKFSGMPLSDMQFRTRSLQKLNQDSIEAVRWMMNHNYKVKGQSVNFAFESAPTKNSQLALSRNGLLFTLKYTTSVYCVFTDKHFFEITTTGEFREILSATSTTNAFDSRLRSVPFLLFDLDRNCFEELKNPARRKPDEPFDKRVETGQHALYDKTKNAFYICTAGGVLKKIPAPNRKFLLFDMSIKVFSDEDPNILNVIDPRVEAGHFALYDPNLDKFYTNITAESQELQEIQVHLTKEEQLNFTQKKARLLKRTNERIDVECSIPDIPADLIPKVALDYDVVPVATVELVATLDMRLADRANATIEVEICTDSNQEFLVYVGSSYAPEIIRVENLASVRSSERLRGGSRAEAINTKLNQSQVSIGAMLEQIKRGGENDFDTLLSGVIHLFNGCIQSQLYRKYLQKAVVDSAISVREPRNLQEWVERMLKGGEDFTDLVAMAESELERVFFARKPEEFLIFIRVFSTKTALQMRESAFFVVKNTGTLMGRGGYFVLEDVLRSNAFVILTAIDVVKKALQFVQGRKRIVVFGGANITVQPFTDVAEVPEFFIAYLQRVFQNELPDNPFQERFHAVERVITASKQLAGLLPSADRTPNSDHEQEERSEEDYDVPRESRLIAVRPPPYREVLQLAKIEKIAALAVRNPVIQGIMDTSVSFSLKQWLSLYPATTPVFPYFVLIEMAAAMGGIIVARHAILHPKDKQNRAMRYWKAGTDGLVITVFTMGAVINIYLAINPENTHISNAKFWSQLAPAPIIIASSYAGWGAIAPSTKERWFRRRPGIRDGLEVSAKFAYYGGVFEITLLNIVNSPGNILYLGIPVLPALGFSLLHLTRFRETGNAIISYLAAGNFAYMIARELKNYDLDENPKTDWTYYTRMVYWSLALMYSLYFMTRHATRFVRRYEGDPEFVVQDSVPVGTGDFDSSRYPVVPRDRRAQMERRGSTPTERESLIGFAYQMHQARRNSNGSDDLEAARTSPWYRKCC